MASLHVNDVVERKAGKPASIPETGAAFDSPSSGFPTHKRRLRVSKFKQNQQLARANGNVAFEAPGEPTSAVGDSGTDKQKKTVRFGPENPSETQPVSEHERIDRENNERIASMSPAEIEAARRELMEDLNPQLLHKLMLRANLDEKYEPSPFDIPVTQPAPTSDSKPESTKTAARPVQIEDAQEEAVPLASNAKKDVNKAIPKKPLPRNLDQNTHFDEDAPPTNPPEDLLAMADVPVKPHFPVPYVPDLDPNDPDFLETLRQKYFPETPSDPTKLAWMAPLPSQDSVADRESPYHPGQATISTSALRFDFRGKLLPPTLSRTIPVSKGLHHHGLAPEAAGYTIEELSIYARSAVPAQRCIAFQTIGRILFRLGHGDWGTGIEDPIAMGIWNSVKEGRILDSLTNAAMQTSGHRGSQAYATEALWLFEKGGWKEKTRGR
ncbi:hypothetical protein BROUX41_000378 [Berkeleyomyces rouxiae]|uniref:uncharacterized protein n=1 Tax=Berkeleyomyces rouxiae TaxID=2035830 RepID=UPI003B806EBC